VSSPAGIEACGAAHLSLNVVATSHLLEQDDEQDNDENERQYSTTDNHLFLLDTAQSSSLHQPGVRGG